MGKNGEETLDNVLKEQKRIELLLLNKGVN